mmetsp:Transcript_119060/g.384436  ORF Transcript_119060/g.384436 Transcript_119060/m.384436 type:complete len:295 (+) Transcript_119060:645-1529(+)
MPIIVRSRGKCSLGTPAWPTASSARIRSTLSWGKSNLYSPFANSTSSGPFSRPSASLSYLVNRPLCFAAAFSAEAFRTTLSLFSWAVSIALLAWFTMTSASRVDSLIRMRSFRRSCRSGSVMFSCLPRMKSVQTLWAAFVFAPQASTSPARPITSSSPRSRRSSSSLAFSFKPAHSASAAATRPLSSRSMALACSSCSFCRRSSSALRCSSRCLLIASCRCASFACASRAAAAAAACWLARSCVCCRACCRTWAKAGCFSGGSPGSGASSAGRFMPATVGGRQVTVRVGSGGPL